MFVPIDLCGKLFLCTVYTMRKMKLVICSHCCLAAIHITMTLVGF